MAATSDLIRHDIELTRARLARELDELADRTLPNRVLKRRLPAAREAGRRARLPVLTGLAVAGCGLALALLLRRGLTR